jgi:hypothetical protein
MTAMEEIRNQEISFGEPGEPRQAAARRQGRQGGSDMIWNVLTLLVWLGIAIMIMAFISIYLNPASSLNLLRPFQPTLLAALNLPTDIPTPTAELPSASPTPVPTQTDTPLPPTVTDTPVPTATETPTPGPSLTPTIKALYPFILRNDPVTIAGDAMPDHDTCKIWVAGQTYDLQGAPMVGITVMLGGRLDGSTLYQLSLTGTALQFGQAGYEFIVADTAVKSKQSIWVQLFDQALIPLSGRIYLDTSNDCKQNLILINFRQVR